MLTRIGRRSSAAFLARRRHPRAFAATTGSSSVGDRHRGPPPRAVAAVAAGPRRGAVVVGPSSSSSPRSHRRAFRAASRPLDRPRVVPSDDAVENGRGIEAPPPRRDDRGGRSKKSTGNERARDIRGASAAVGGDDDDVWTEYEDGGGGEDGMIPPLEERNGGILSEYDFGEGTTTGGGEYEEWHGRKEEEFYRLSADTEAAIEAGVANEGDVRAALSLMRKWNAFLSDVTSELYSLSDFRRANPQYPPSDFMTSITYDAAERSEGLLARILDAEEALPPEMEANAYELAMEAWSQAFHARSGDRCEAVLSRYGERFGGDMTLTPTVEAYKTVLRAHLKSCSSYAPSDAVDAPASPGEKALGVSSLLIAARSSGDMYLRPDAELHSLAVSAARHTLLDWRGRRRFRRTRDDARDGDGDGPSLEADLAGALLGELGRMESSLGEAEGAGGKEEDGGEDRPSPEQWRRSIGAYADALAVVASVPVPAGEDDDGRIAERLLTRLEHLATSNSRAIVGALHDSGMGDDESRNLSDEIRRSVESSYTSAISARLTLSKERGAFDSFGDALDNAVSSEEAFRGMERRSEECPPAAGFLFPAPTPDNYGALVECWCECVRKRYSTDESNAAMSNLEELPHLRAEGLLKELEIRQAARPVDGSIYANVVWAWGQTLNWPAIYRREQFDYAGKAVDLLLRKTMHRYENGSIYFAWNGTVTKMYNFALRLNSKMVGGGEAAMRRSLKLLDDMEGWRLRSDDAIARPDAFTFGLILKTISNSGVGSAAAEAEAMLKRMEDAGVKPRERHYLGVIRAHSRVGQMDVADPRKAEATLRHVREKYDRDGSVKPTAAIYTACISAYGGSKRHNSVSKVMELFDEVKELHGRTGDEDFRPDGMLYGAVLGAVSKARSKDDSTLRQAIRLLDGMEASHDAGEIDAGPNRYAYTNLLHAISRSRMADGHSLAEDLVLRMDDRSRRLDDESIRPDVHAYTTLIQILAGCGRDDAVNRARGWFRRMEERHAAGDGRCKPNKVTYTALINCLRRSDREGAGEEADGILSAMEEKCRGGDLDLRPDAYVYASVIDTWARCRSNDKAVRAWDIYERMRKQYSAGNLESKPNNVIITSIIKACGYTRGGREDKRRALKVLLECMAELKARRHVVPTPLTYRALLNAARALVADDAKRRPISATIFETCCRNGQLDGTVLEALERVQPELYVKLPGAIPPKWKQNVREDGSRS